MTRAICLMMAILTIIPAAAEDLVLVDGGRPLGAIVAAEQDARAANELRTYLLKMTGSELDVVEQATDGPRIVLGALGEDECNRLDLGLDGFVMRREGDVLRLAGATPTGTLNAVYRFLDRQGVRWYLPGEVGEVVPQRDTLAVGDLDVIERPDYLHRVIWPSLAARGMSAEDKALFSEWTRRNLYGGVPVNVGHNFARIAPVAEYFE